MEPQQGSGTWTLTFGAEPTPALALVGGKGANLGAMTGAGLPVPPGYVLTTAAYERYAADTGLSAAIARACETLDLYRLKECEALSHLVIAHMEQHPLPAPVAADVLAMYRALSGGRPDAPVAVRSSATAEDLPTASFAGQLESYLNVQGEEALLAAVCGCWASLWSPRAIHYRQQRGIAHLSTAMAVVVQQMVPAEAAGVLFMAHPVSGRRDQVFIEAAPGLGEGVVAGLAGVDQYVLARASGTVVERSLCAERGAPVLEPADLERLRQLGLQVEKLFGAPQDVEWAVAEGQVWLLQARPMTTLPEAADPLAGVLLRTVKNNRMTRMTAAMLSDRWTTPLTPFDLETTGRGQEEGLLGMLAEVGLVGPRFEDSFIAVDGVLLHVLPYNFRVGMRLLRNGPWLLTTLFKDPAEWSVKELPALEQRLSALEQEARAFADATDEELLAVPERVTQLMREIFLSRKAHFFDPVRRGLFAGLVRLAGRRQALQLQADLMAGIDHVSARIQAGLEALAESIRTRPALAEAIDELEPALFLWRLPLLPDGLAFAGELAAFLDRYGCRELYYGGPSWGEAPEAVVGILRSLLTAEAGGAGDGAEAGDGDGVGASGGGAGAGRDPGARFARASRQAEAALPFFLRPLFRRLLHLVRSGEAFMEESHWQLNRPIPVMRAAARELGRRLAKRGLLPDAADVFYLVPYEIAELVHQGSTTGPDVAKLIARRKQRLEAARRKGTLVPMQYLPGANSGSVLKGVPVGCGQVTARVRVIRSEADFGRLRRGEVLVAPYTNPAWTPLFSLASAVVVDTGGAASHAAIVAREYAIPAVMGARTATTALADGDLVQVDGMAGTVRIMQRAGQRKER